MKYQVYILENETGKKYIGLSENVRKRLEQHNEGESKWTAKFGPWNLKWRSEQMSLSEARKLENLMKKQKGGKGLVTLMDKFQQSGS